MFNKRIPPTPLSQSLALVVSGGLQVSLQTFLLRLQLLGVVGLQALAGADVLQLLQQLLLLVDEDEAVSLRVQQPRPRLAVQFGDLHLDVGDPVSTKGKEEEEEQTQREERETDEFLADKCGFRQLTL